MNTSILVVDDDQRLTNALRRTLTYEGYHVSTAAHGEEALQVARKRPRGIARHPFAAASTMNAAYSTISYQGQRVRVYTLANDDFGQLHIIQTARSQEDIEQSLNNLHALLLGEGSLSPCAPCSRAGSSRGACWHGCSASPALLAV